MSSLLDDLNSRAYASDRPGYGTATEPAQPPVEACDVCREDYVDLTWGLCAPCEPREDETCEAYEARVREIRSRCSCTVRADFGGSFASGSCTVHGFAWHTRWSR